MLVTVITDFAAGRTMHRCWYRVDQEHGNKTKATDVRRPCRTRVAHWLALVCPSLLPLSHVCV